MKTIFAIFVCLLLVSYAYAFSSRMDMRMSDGGASIVGSSDFTWVDTGGIAFKDTGGIEFEDF